ncbi:MAG: class I SAM-dependent methyltransferase [Chloroflexi bacterium]|nr:class I SAM-dependent methyltransferase [Chloroflexota bacterium]MDA1270641.1 class I SAM-dependent methyltransferase [Chloroflexota bacterium]
MGAVEDYAALIDQVGAQRERLQGPVASDFWGGANARRFRADPKRQLDDDYETMAAFVRPGDVFVDAGGGAGRLSLPMSYRCREVINVDPSPGMGQEFEDCVAESGIANARFVLADWLDADGVEGDVVHAANVTYFVRDIARFVAKLEAAARRRVIISVWSVANPMHNAVLFKMVYGEDQALVPGHAQLLPALWELGVLPDVRFLPQGTRFNGVPQKPAFPQSKADAVEMALAGIWLAPQHRDRAEKVILENFDGLFEHDADGFIPQWLPDVRQVLITWEPGR